MTAAPYHHKPEDVWDLQFGDFPDADIGREAGQ